MFAASFAVFGTGAGAVRIFVHFSHKKAHANTRGFLVAFGPPVRYTRVS